MTKPPIEMMVAVRAKAAPRALGGPRPVDRPLGKRGADVLGRVPLFAGLGRRHVRRLADLADEVSFPAGSHVVEAGAPGGALYVILEGEAKVVRAGKVVARLLPGDFFGEISLLDGGPRTASVVAATPLTGVRISRRAFLKLLEGEPTVGARVLQELARRLRQIERPLTG